jgi:hypothetical protein
MHMFALVAGALLGAASLGSLGTSLPLPWTLLGMALGATVILLGAAGLGRGISPGSPTEAGRTGSGVSMPAQLTGQLDPGLSRWMMTDKYPTFRLDQGPFDPPARVAGPESA